MIPSGVSYKVGDHVRVLTDSLTTHHRTPSYVKGNIGRIVSICGTFPNPEKRAYGATGLPTVALYRVEFNQWQVWENYNGSTKDKVCVDIFHGWLENI